VENLKARESDADSEHAVQRRYEAEKRHRRKSDIVQREKLQGESSEHNQHRTPQVHSDWASSRLIDND